jgi:hypothetical protein
MIIPIELRYHPSDVGEIDPGPTLEGIVYEADASAGAGKLQARLIHVATERAPAAATLNTAVELVLHVSGYVAPMVVPILVQALYDKMKRKPPGKMIVQSTVVEFEQGEITRVIAESIETYQANEERG